MTLLRGILVAGVAVLAGCAGIRGTDGPTTTATVAAATQYWFRGVPQSAELVAQGDVTIAVPLENGDTFAVTSWGNYQLSSSTGNAAFAPGNGGDFTELDVTGTYTAKVDEVTVFGGVVSYNFSNAVGLSTHELFAGVTFDSENQGLSHTLTAYYDIDQADDFYLTYGLSHTEILDERFTAAFSGLVGLMGEDQAQLYFGDERAGVSDVSATGLLTYKYDEFTMIFAKATAVAVPDPHLRDVEEERGFKTSAVVFTIGASWSL